jgi:hypothetical protein
VSAAHDAKGNRQLVCHASSNHLKSILTSIYENVLLHRLVTRKVVMGPKEKDRERSPMRAIGKKWRKIFPIRGPLIYHSREVE